MCIRDSGKVDKVLDHSSEHPTGIVGKLYLEITQIDKIVGLPHTSAVYFRIRHYPYMYKTKKVLNNTKVLSFKQRFLIPITSHFSTFSLEMYSSVTERWITERFKEELLGSHEILVIDLMKLGHNNKLEIQTKINFNLPGKKDKQQAKDMKEANTSVAPVSNDGAISLKFKLANLSSFKSFITPLPPHFIEGARVVYEDYDKYHIRLQVARLRRALYYAWGWLIRLKELFRFKYPRASYISIVLFTFLTLVIDISNVYNYLALIFFLIMAYNHPKLHSKVIKFLETHLFNESNMTTKYRRPEVIKTMFDMDYVKFTDVYRFKKKIGDPDSLYTFYKKMKKVLIHLVIGIQQGINLLEKFKNLLTWYDPYRTVIFMIFLGLVITFVNVFHLRYLILFAIWCGFWDGRKYYDKLQEKNLNLARLFLCYLLRTYYPEFEPIVFKDLNAPWPAKLVLSADFGKRMIEEFKERLDLILPEDFLTKHFDTPAKLIEDVGLVHYKLKVAKKEATERLELFETPKTYRALSLSSLLNFLDNLPSDYFLVVNDRI
eukprot:TRINITY_DN12332_c0_g1_i4.p1 TRINITY_DN12332_c0_g1~~TRINITY_DN12332_c0_g1_i4.p1  ORF type:complete len:565 (+),score=97.08 TRINITY_DN12332_c0_g1_i4:60-1697(+)